MSSRLVDGLWICVLLIDVCFGIMYRDSIGIDMNDILNEKLMPMSMVYVESNSKNPLQFDDDPNNILTNITNNMRSISIGDFGSALNLMNFHR